MFYFTPSCRGWISPANEGVNLNYYLCISKRYRSLSSNSFDSNGHSYVTNVHSVGCVESTIVDEQSGGVHF